MLQSIWNLSNIKCTNIHSHTLTQSNNMSTSAKITIFGRKNSCVGIYVGIKIRATNLKRNKSCIYIQMEKYLKSVKNINYSMN